jgi:hypothetical protein
LISGIGTGRMRDRLRRLPCVRWLVVICHLPLHLRQPASFDPATVHSRGGAPAAAPDLRLRPEMPPTSTSPTPPCHASCSSVTAGPAVGRPDRAQGSGKSFRPELPEQAWPNNTAHRSTRATVEMTDHNHETAPAEAIVSLSSHSHTTRRRQP